MKGYIDERINSSDRKKYQDWIDANITEAQGWCRSSSEQMAEKFKELRIVGVVSEFTSDHAWCLTPESYVVDPTAHQFNFKYPYPDYPLEVSDFPKGKCVQCGELIWPDTPRTREWAGTDVVGQHIRCEEILLREINGIR